MAKKTGTVPRKKKTDKELPGKISRNLVWARNSYTLHEQRIFSIVGALASAMPDDTDTFSCAFGEVIKVPGGINPITKQQEPPTYNLRMNLRDVLGADFKDGKKYNNIVKAREALHGFNAKTISFIDETGTKWVEIPPFSIIQGDLNYGYANVKILDVTWQFFKSNDRGYNKVDMSILLGLTSKYAMELYLISAGLQHPVTITIDYFRSKWQLENKYAVASDFRKRTLDYAKDNLIQKGIDIPLEYIRNGAGKTAETTAVTIYPTDWKGQRRNVKKYGAESYFTKEELAILRTVLDDKGIANNIKLLTRCKMNNPSLRSFMDKISILATTARRKDNPGGWFISMLKQEPERTVRPLLLPFPTDD